MVDRGRPDPHGVLIGRLDRRGRLLWSLPKGHVEAGETPEDAAIREVEEETGIRGHVVAKLGVIDFWFVAGGQRVHKTVHHFLLEADSGELSDADIEVDEVAWVPLDQLPHRLAYDTERKLLDRLPEQLGGPNHKDGPQPGGLQKDGLQKDAHGRGGHRGSADRQGATGPGDGAGTP